MQLSALRAVGCSLLCFAIVAGCMISPNESTSNDCATGVATDCGNATVNDTNDATANSTTTTPPGIPLPGVGDGAYGP